MTQTGDKENNREVREELKEKKISIPGIGCYSQSIEKSH